MNRPFRTTAYRYPNERLILALTLIVVFLVIVLTATATFCLSAVFVLGMLAMAYSFTSRHRQALQTQAKPITAETTPDLYAIAQEAAVRLQVEPVELYIVPSRVLNAYTFGTSSPKTIVLHSALLNLMDRDELQFVIGHEMGHVALGHTEINSLVGGMAGIPAPSEASLVLVMMFRSWARACEFSTDRAGLLACNNPPKAISALVKLQAGKLGSTPEALQRALQAIEIQDDNWLNSLGELLETHPLIARRIEQIRTYAASEEYRRLQTAMNQNLGRPIGN